MVGIGEVNVPSFTAAGGNPLKKFMETSVAAAKKKIEESGSVEGFKASFTSADGEISVTITSKAMTEANGRSGYGLSYEMDMTENGIHMTHGGGDNGVTASGEDVDHFLSMMTDMNDASAAKSVKMTEEEYLDYVKSNFPPDQYEKIVKGMNESKAAYEAQQKELSGQSGTASAPASGGGTRLDRMKAQSEDAARLAERLMNSALGRDVSSSNNAARWLASSISDPATAPTATPNAQAADESSAPLSYKPVDLKT